MLAIAAMLLLGSAVVRAEEAAPPEMDLDQAVAAGIANASAVVQAEGTLEGSDAAKLRATGAFLPTLSANASAGLSSSERFDPGTG